MPHLFLISLKRKIDESLLNQHKRIFAGISEGKELEELLQQMIQVVESICSK